MFLPSFFNTKYSNLLKDERHAVRSQNINKSWTLINFKKSRRTTWFEQIQTTELKTKRYKKLWKPNRNKYIHLTTLYKTSVPPALPLWCLLKQGRRASPRLLGSKICRVKQEVKSKYTYKNHALISILHHSFLN